MPEAIDKNWEECTKRKPISKAMRKLVYEKYNGHCAYCGKELKMNEMQVDHIIPVMQSYYGTEEEALKVRQMIEDGSFNSIDNLMPTCRACNFYKSMNNIEGLRNRILTELEHTCRSTFQTKLAMQYGMMEYKGWDGKFYFEKVKKEE